MSVEAQVVEGRDALGRWRPIDAPAVAAARCQELTPGGWSRGREDRRVATYVRKPVRRRKGAR